MSKIPIGISACLMGDPVRYDGSHKRSDWIDALGEYFELCRICPEVAIGMGVPRQPIRLVDVSAETRALGVANPALDVTASLTEYGAKIGAENGSLNGFILMERSPSCGIDSTKLYGANGEPLPELISGVFARALVTANPDLPMEENIRLGDPVLRERFIARVFAYHNRRTGGAGVDQ
jgi:uncharacterized protein YbbK (DUF523 family)